MWETHVRDFRHVKMSGCRPLHERPRIHTDNAEPERQETRGDNTGRERRRQEYRAVYPGAADADAAWNKELAKVNIETSDSTSRRMARALRQATE